MSMWYIYPCTDEKSQINEQICPVCQDSLTHPLTLPCDHTFCYLCIKGVFARKRLCALCRQPIPEHYILKPPGNSELSSSSLRKPEFCWLYEAKNGGWWLYEERISSVIEEAYQDKKEFIKLQISGFTYVVDFKSMVQFREERPNRRRCIDRRLLTGEEEVKGIAGIPVFVREKN